MSEHRRLLKSTSTISSLTILSRIFGYLREQRIAFLLGTSDVADAYRVAFLIPNLLRRLVGEGAVSAAFIPTFTRYLNDENRKEAWEFANTLLTAITVFITIVTILGVVLSPWIVPLFASGFAETPGKVEVTTVLNRIMFPYIAFVSLSAFAMGILNSFHRFAAPAFAPVLLNLCVIAFSFLTGFFSNPEIALAVGVVAGGALQVAIQIPPLIQSGWRFRWIWNLAHPGVRRVGLLMAPLLFGIGIVQVNVLVDTQFASYLSTGSAASIGVADRVMELVLGGYAIALSTAILPLLSRQAADRRLEEMRTTLNFALRIVLFVTLPATVGLILLRREIIQVLFEHGAFDANSTALTAWALLFFAVGLSAFSMVKIIVPAFYALHDTRTPVWTAFVAMLLNIGLNFLFIRPLENGGPALATSLSAAFNCIALIVIFRRRHGSLDVRSVAASCLKFAAASMFMGVAAYSLIRIPGFYSGPFLQRALALTTTILASTGAYFGAAYLLRTREIQEMRGVYRKPAPAVGAVGEKLADPQL